MYFSFLRVCVCECLYAKRLENRGSREAAPIRGLRFNSGMQLLNYRRAFFVVAVAVFVCACVCGRHYLCLRFYQTSILTRLLSRKYCAREWFRESAWLLFIARTRCKVYNCMLVSLVFVSFYLTNTHTDRLMGWWEVRLFCQKFAVKSQFFASRGGEVEDDNEDLWLVGQECTTSVRRVRPHNKKGVRENRSR